MSQNQRYREQIDACRPGSDDLAQAALADLARGVATDRALADELARSQRFDREVSVAMHDVPVPAGLLERLEAMLVSADVTANAETTDDVTLPPKPSNFSRRNILVAASSLAAVLLIAVGATFWPRTGRDITNEQLVEIASGWNLRVLPANWKNLSAASLPPAGFAAPVEVRKATQWQSFATADGQKGVVFNLTSGVRPARLYVIASRDKYDLPTTPYRKLKGTSNGVAIGAWHSGGLLYVVVVDETGQKLSDFVREKQIAFGPPAAILAASSAARPA